VRVDEVSRREVQVPGRQALGDPGLRGALDGPVVEVDLRLARRELEQRTHIGGRALLVITILEVGSDAIPDTQHLLCTPAEHLQAMT